MREKHEMPNPRQPLTLDDATYPVEAVRMAYERGRVEQREADAQMADRFAFDGEGDADTRARAIAAAIRQSDSERLRAATSDGHLGDPRIEWEVDPDGDMVVALRGSKGNFLAAHGKTHHEALARFGEVLMLAFGDSSTHAQLVQEMEPYLQHKAECQKLNHYGVGVDDTRDCTCGLALLRRSPAPGTEDSHGPE